MRCLIRSLCLGLLLCLPLAGRGESPSPALALSFDDGLDPARDPRADEWNRQLLQALDQAQLRSMLFVAGGLVDSPQGRAALRRWGEAGHALGNHSYAHRNINDAALASFIADAARNQRLLAKMPGAVLRYRFPYLEEGERRDRRDGFRRWLQHQGYASGAVTAETDDWFLNQTLLSWRARCPSRSTAPLIALHIEQVRQRAAHADHAARVLLGRPLPQLLLLHANALNAEALPALISALRADGWRLIDPLQAYADDFYQTPPDVLPARGSLLGQQLQARGQAWAPPLPLPQLRDRVAALEAEAWPAACSAEAQHAGLPR